MATPTLLSSLYWCASARPAPTGTWAPTMPWPPKKLVARRYMCMEPPLPLEAPVVRPISSAMTSSTVPPRMMWVAWSRYEVMMLSLWSSAASSPTITASCPSYLRAGAASGGQGAGVQG